MQIVKCIIKLNIPAGQASAAPPTGPILGQYGLNIMDFCKSFNEKTQDLNAVILPVLIIVYQNNSFDYVIRIPTTSSLFKKLLSIDTGSGKTGAEIIGVLTTQQLYELAILKSKEFPYYSDLHSICTMLIGTAESMGILVRTSL